MIRRQSTRVAAIGLMLLCSPLVVSSVLGQSAPELNPNAILLPPLVIGGGDLVVVGIDGPATLIAGLSGTFTVTVRNIGNVAIYNDVVIIFAGTLNQTGQIVALNGLGCTVGYDAGINAAVRCNGAMLAPGASTVITVQGRGQTGGAGQLIASLNPSRAITELNYDNNFLQKNVAID